MIVAANPVIRVCYGYHMRLSEKFWLNGISCLVLLSNDGGRPAQRSVIQHRLPTTIWSSMHWVE